MREKYRIGFFVAAVICIIGITGAYELSYKYVSRQEAQEEETKKEESIQTEGSAKKESGYYLREESGYIVVYIGRSKEVYEYTSIRLENLPEDLQTEIKNGKYIETPEDLYGFLENYSS